MLFQGLTSRTGQATRRQSPRGTGLMGADVLPEQYERPKRFLVLLAPMTLWMQSAYFRPGRKTERCERRSRKPCGLSVLACLSINSACRGRSTPSKRQRSAVAEIAFVLLFAHSAVDPELVV